MTVVVCGSRSVVGLAGWLWVEEALARFAERSGDAVSRVVEGGQRARDAAGRVHGGADFWAQTWAVVNGVPCTTVPADWAALGRAAGPVRNRRMATEFGAEACVGVWDGVSRGTRSCLRECYDAGLDVFVFFTDGRPDWFRRGVSGGRPARGGEEAHAGRDAGLSGGLRGRG